MSPAAPRLVPADGASVQPAIVPASTPVGGTDDKQEGAAMQAAPRCRVCRDDQAFIAAFTASAVIGSERTLAPTAL
jgi:hypothetical protein